MENIVAITIPNCTYHESSVFCVSHTGLQPSKAALRFLCFPLLRAAPTMVLRELLLLSDILHLGYGVDAALRFAHRLSVLLPRFSSPS